MTTRDDLTRSTVRAYHESWTTKRFDSAIGLLANDLKVEVPVNDYPTTESFAEALRGFGAMVKRVELLVDRIGAIRVAEHFTVEQGRITRIRQIHDTTAIRAAGLVRG